MILRWAPCIGKMLLCFQRRLYWFEAKRFVPGCGQATVHDMRGAMFMTIEQNRTITTDPNTLDLLRKSQLHVYVVGRTDRFDCTIYEFNGLFCYRTSLFLNTDSFQKKENCSSSRLLLYSQKVKKRHKFSPSLQTGIVGCEKN